MRFLTLWRSTASYVAANVSNTGAGIAAQAPAGQVLTVAHMVPHSRMMISTVATPAAVSAAATASSERAVRRPSYYSGASSYSGSGSGFGGRKKFSRDFEDDNEEALVDHEEHEGNNRRFPSKRHWQTSERGDSSFRRGSSGSGYGDRRGRSGYGAERGGRFVNASARASADSLSFNGSDGKGRAKNALPQTPVPSPEEMELSKFPLSKPTLKALQSKGITALFPIQACTFKFIFDGQDVLARAKTGTGKTLSFALPIVERLIQSNLLPKQPEKAFVSKSRFRPSAPARIPSVLVLAPVRELANQVKDVFAEIAPQLRVACFYGGVSQRVNEFDIRDGVDIAVGTPGRVIDLINQGILDVSKVKVFVLDEADRMLADNWADEMEKCLEALPKGESKPQTVLFSATIPAWVKNVTKTYLKPDYKLVNLVDDSEEQTSETISHFAMCARVSEFGELASKIAETHSGETGRTLIFTNTKRDADGFADALDSRVGVIHGDVSQATRERVLQKFRNGKLRFLVATDVAARGLDIPELDLVVQIEPPVSPEMYVHRSGRTGRAGRKGTSVLLFSRPNIESVMGIERATRIVFQKLKVPEASE